ncbi:MAG: cyclic beta 1-2 glucan synthetase, partial [Chthoniobacterales bacterium]
MPSKSVRSKPARPRPKPARTSASEPPLRAELFGAEQLARHAEALAAKHQLGASREPHGLLARLRRNDEVLRAFNRSTLAVDKTRRVTPAAEWLLDNFYLIEEQIQLARRHLPRGYSRELPRLANGAVPGRLRVYDLGLELISHLDAQVDAESLSAFVGAYQKGSALKLGELWAIPIMLRLGLIENLQRITTALARARDDRNEANLWVERLQEMAETNPSRVVIVVAEMAGAEFRLTSSFVAEFCQRLSRLNPVLHLARSWLEQRLGEQGESIEQLIHQESQRQASDQVSVSHSIASLRLLGAIDWKEFVETLSLIEQTLRLDPADVYADMDFATRDCYRHVVESLARRSRWSEAEVAHKAIELAQENAQHHGRDDRRGHVGYFLIDQGLPQLERAAAARRHWRKACERLLLHFPFTFYAGGVLALTLLATLGFWCVAKKLPAPGWALILCTGAFLIGVSQLAVALLNWLVGLTVRPRLLPRLDYSSGVAPESRTIVVVPTLLGSVEGVDELVDALEIHHLANRDDRLHFALLTDWRDAPGETAPDDKLLLERAREGIRSLNRKYAAGRGDLFFLFHRPRRWNASEGVWMGYERKRGKLMQFNAYLRGQCADCFAEVVGETAVLPSIRYVITLDTDTQLPREAARQLAGTMAHPLNRPQFDPAREIVTEGYSLMQPRVDMNLASARRSWFVQLQAGDAGIDPYTRAVSDVYQDLFEEGSFIGKGIYDVDAFERALAGRFPENRILSHDLLESVYARCALVSDAKFYEEYPARYDVDVVRRHRWIRGDWQIMAWLLPWTRGAEGRRVRNPISALSRWKIFDNLRRSLVPLALLLFLFGCWGLLPYLGGRALGLVVAILFLPGLLAQLVGLVRKPAQLPWLMHLRSVGAAWARTFGQNVLALATLPHDALVSLDAIGRTVFRMLVTRKQLLEWRTSGEATQAERTTLGGSFATMWLAPVSALAGGILLGVMQPRQLTMAWPLFALWLSVPWITWRISQ